MKKDVALTREMTTEEMRRYLTSQQPRPDWLPEGYADPIRFICLCIDHGARDAIGDSLPDPQEPLSELTAQRFFRGKRILWLFNVLCEQLAFEHGNAFSGSQNTADLLSSFAFLMEKFAIPYLTKRHKDNARMRNAIRSVCDSVTVETVKCAPMFDGSDGGEAHQLALAVVPDEFRRRLRDLLDLDAATRQTAQAADGGEIARKVADAVDDKLKDIAAVAHGAKVAAERAADNTTTMLQMFRDLKPGWLTGEEKPPRKYNTAAGTVKMKIFEMWIDCKAHPQQYGAKLNPGYADFLFCCGGREIHQGLPLDQFIHDQAKKDNTTDLELLTKILRGMNQNKRNAEAKKAQKPKSGQMAKRK